MASIQQTLNQGLGALGATGSMFSATYAHSPEGQRKAELKQLNENIPRMDKANEEVMEILNPDEKGISEAEKEKRQAYKDYIQDQLTSALRRKAALNPTTENVYNAYKGDPVGYWEKQRFHEAEIERLTKQSEQMKQKAIESLRRAIQEKRAQKETAKIQEEQKISGMELLLKEGVISQQEYFDFALEDIDYTAKGMEKEIVDKYYGGGKQ